MKKPFRDEPERLFFAWCVVRGAWCVVRGAWCVVRGAWCVVRGAQHFGAYADTA